MILKENKKSWSFKVFILCLMAAITLFFVNPSSDAITYLAGNYYGFFHDIPANYSEGPGPYYPIFIHSPSYGMISPQVLYFNDAPWGYTGGSGGYYPGSIYSHFYNSAGVFNPVSYPYSTPQILYYNSDPWGFADIDPFYQTIERLKEEGNFENWPCKNGPIRAGIILSKDHFSSLQEVDDDNPIISISDDNKGIVATDYHYSWGGKEKGSVNVRLMVMQTCLQAQNFLIRRFAVSTMPPDSIHLPPRGVRYGIYAGDVSFVTGMNTSADSDPKIRFVRNNIYVEIRAYEEMRTEIKAISKDLDGVLLSRPTGDDALKLMPVIKRFRASKDTIKPNEKNNLIVDVEFPAGNPLILKPYAGIERVSGFAYVKNQVVFKVKATEGSVYIDELDQYYYSSEEEGLHTITLLLSSKDTGIVKEAQMTIEVTDGEEEEEIENRLGLPYHYYNNPFYNPGSYSNRFPATTYNNISIRYPYNVNLYEPNLPAHIWDRSGPFYITAGYNDPVSYSERYSLSINPKEPYGGYISPYGYNFPLYTYSSSYPYPALP